MVASKTNKKPSSSSMKQAKLSFAATKPKPAALKGKGKAKEVIKEEDVSDAAPSRVQTDDEPDVKPVKVEPAPVVVPTIVREELDLEDKAKRWQKHYGEIRRIKMGGLKPVHGEGQTKIHQILRVFDNSHEFGPCVGVTRLERWERAHALGLNPPNEVREILMTKQGTELDEFSQCVFYGEV